jgi:plasmid stabilization system protein ParE
VDELLFHPEAEAEYLQAFHWYEDRSASASLRFEAEIESVLERIRFGPEVFPRYDETQRFASYGVFHTASCIERFWIICTL